MKKKILTTLIALIFFVIILSAFWIIISFVMHLVDNHTFNLWSIRTFFISIATLFVSLGITRYILKDNEPPPIVKVEKPKKVVKVSKFQQRLEEMQREKNKNKNKK